MTGLVSLSADGNTLAVRKEKIIDVINTMSGATIRTVEGKPSHLGYALSPDGKTLVAAQNAYRRIQLSFGICRPVTLPRSRSTTPRRAAIIRLDLRSPQIAVFWLA